MNNPTKLLEKMSELQLISGEMLNNIASYLKSHPEITRQIDKATLVKWGEDSETGMRIIKEIENLMETI